MRESGASFSSRGTIPFAKLEYNRQGAILLREISRFQEETDTQNWPVLLAGGKPLPFETVVRC